MVWLHETQQTGLHHSALPPPLPSPGSTQGQARWCVLPSASGLHYHVDKREREEEDDKHQVKRTVETHVLGGFPLRHLYRIC